MRLAVLWLLAGAGQAVSLCALPGAPGISALSGQINDYWEPRDNSRLPVGTTRIPLVPHQDLTALASGDVLLIIQMQGADIRPDNNNSYGDGSGAGFSALHAGHFEWVRVERVFADAITIRGAGPEAGLLHAYSQTPPTLSSGVTRFQLVKVPQYEQARLHGDLTTAAWNGRTGGVLALEVRGELDMNGHRLNVSGQGFRGGAALALQGGVGDARDFAFRAPGGRELLAGFGLHASKGEGLAGTPRYLIQDGKRQDSWPVANSSRESDGYVGGSLARGAPANAGGGGSSPRVDNRYPAGGGGGGGGVAGAAGSTPGKVDAGGFGGVGIKASSQMLLMGGGGGAGTRAAGQDTGGSGGAGGGIIVLRVGELAGDGGFVLNGAPGFDAVDAGGGGGGAGSLWIEMPLAPERVSEVSASGGAGGQGKAAGGQGGTGRVLTSGSIVASPNIATFQRADSRGLGLAAAHRCRPLGMLISGEVYIDNGGDAGTVAAHDGRRHVSEPGMARLPVWLEDEKGKRVSQTQTGEQGHFAFSLDKALAGRSLTLQVAAPEHYQTVSATVPDLPSHPFRWLGENRWRFTVQPEHHQDQVRLGLLEKPVLALPENRRAERGSTQLFLIRYLSHTHGRVRFTLDADQRLSGDWKHTFFIDPTCREESKFMDQQRISRWFDVEPGKPLCVRLRVDVPLQTTNEELNVTVSAETEWQGRAALVKGHAATGSFVLQLGGQ